MNWHETIAGTRLQAILKLTYRSHFLIIWHWKEK